MKENSIEEDMKILKESINEQLRTEVNSLKEDKEKKAINFLKENMLGYEEIDTSILLDINLTQLNLIEKLQKKNEELKEDRDKFKKALGKRITYCNELEKDLFENCSNYVIPIQKVKDKIEEYKNILKTCNKAKDIDRIKAINERILELQELLEGRK